MEDAGLVSMGRYWNWCYGVSEAEKVRQRRSPQLGDHSYISLRLIRKRLEKLMREESKGGMKVLDVGCGQKPHEDVMRKVKYMGWDVSPEARADRIVDLEKGFEAGRKFDGVMCLDVAEHVRNTDKLLTSMAGAVKKGGWLMMSCPFMLWVHDDPGDYYRFTRNFFEQWAEGEWEQVMIEESNTVFSWPWLAANYVVLVLPIPYDVKRLIWGVNNLMVLAVDAAGSWLERVLPKNLRKYIWSAPLEYVVICRGRII